MLLLVFLSAICCRAASRAGLSRLFTNGTDRKVNKIYVIPVYKRAYKCLYYFNQSIHHIQADLRSKGMVFCINFTSKSLPTAITDQDLASVHCAESILPSIKKIDYVYDNAT